MAKIKNSDELLRNAGSIPDRKARKLAIDALNAALGAVDSKAIIKRRITLKNNIMTIGNLTLNLSDFQNIYVVGGGKASGAMAEALADILSERIKEGIVNVPYASPLYKTGTVKLQPASHPVPDESGVKGAKRMLEMVGKAQRNDLVFCLISGGGSSLMPQPIGDISLKDKRQITDALLKCGATITEINTVRKHISELKGGWLAKEACPATVVN